MSHKKHNRPQKPYLNNPMTQPIMSRIEWLDFVRGISIICIVIGHSDDPLSFLHRIVFSFHIPIFFIISGFLFAENKSITLGLWGIVRKRFRASIPSYIATGLLLFVFAMAIYLFNWTLAYYHNPVVNNADSLDFPYLLDFGKRFFLNFCYGTGAEVNQFKAFITPIGPLWFLPSFFCSSIIFYFIIKLIDKYMISIQLMIIMIFTSAGYILGKYIFLPWSFDISLVSQLFMFGGYLMSKNKIYENRTSIWLLIVAACIWLFDLYMGGIDLNKRSYGNFAVVSITGAIAGSYLLMNISYILSRKTANFYYRAISYVGKQSLVILCFHTFDQILAMNPFIIMMSKNWVFLTAFRLTYSLLLAEIILHIPILHSLYPLKGTIHDKKLIR